MLQQLAEQLRSCLAEAESRRARGVADAERDHLMHQAPVAMAIMSGPRHVFTLANPLYCHILGRTEEALLGKTYREAFPELAAAAPQRRLDDAYRTDMRYASPDTLVRLNVGDGDLSERWFQFSIEPMHDLAGRVQGLMSVATDVTARAPRTNSSPCSATSCATRWRPSSARCT